MEYLLYALQFQKIYLQKITLKTRFETNVSSTSKHHCWLFILLLYILYPRHSKKWWKIDFFITSIMPVILIKYLKCFNQYKHLTYFRISNTKCYLITIIFHLMLVTHFCQRCIVKLQENEHNQRTSQKVK